MECIHLRVEFVPTPPERRAAYRAALIEITKLIEEIVANNLDPIPGPEGPGIEQEEAVALLHESL